MNSNNVFTEDAYKIKPSSSLIRKITTKKKKMVNSYDVTKENIKKHIQNRSFLFKFDHPFTLLIAGISGSGKTLFNPIKEQNDDD